MFNIYPTFRSATEELLSNRSHHFLYAQKLIEFIVRVSLEVRSQELWYLKNAPMFVAIGMYAKNILVHRLKKDKKANSSHKHKTRAKRQAKQKQT